MGFCLVNFHFSRVVGVVEAVNEDAGEVPVEGEALLQLPVELGSPEVSCYRRPRCISNSFTILAKIPVSGLQYGVIPKLCSEHFLEQGDHGSEAVCHPVVHLTE